MVKKITLWVVCILWATMIFFFSSQPADDSNEVSLGFTESVIMFILKLDIIDIPVSSGGLEETVFKIAQSINVFIRKLAHFGVYLIFGVLVLNLVKCYLENKFSVLLTFLICLFYAISDEIHQLFVPGRAGMVKDVLIDFSGVVTGVVLFYIVMYLLKHRKRGSVK